MKRGVRSVECEVGSVMLKVWSVKCQLCSGDCEV